MSDIAIAQPQPAPIAPKSVREPRISKRLRQAIDLLAKGRSLTQKAAAEACGLTAEHLSRSLRKDHVRAFLTRRTRETIAVGALRAGERVVELIDSGSEHVSLDASKHILAIEGIRPPADAQAVVNVNISPGYVINMNSPRPTERRLSEPAVIDAKPLIQQASVEHDE